jgi:hypothetical protein
MINSTRNELKLVVSRDGKYLKSDEMRRETKKIVYLINF